MGEFVDPSKSTGQFLPCLNLPWGSRLVPAAVLRFYSKPFPCEETFLEERLQQQGLSRSVIRQQVVMFFSVNQDWWRFLSACFSQVISDRFLDPINAEVSPVWRRTFNRTFFIWSTWDGTYSTVSDHYYGIFKWSIISGEKTDVKENNQRRIEGLLSICNTFWYGGFFFKIRRTSSLLSCDGFFCWYFNIITLEQVYR